MENNGWFLLNTDEFWGLFAVSATDYPDEFKNNINKSIYLKEDSSLALNKRLIEIIGKNTLVKEYDKLYGSMPQNTDLYPLAGRVFYKA